MIRYIIRRLLGAFLVVIVISIATFGIFFIAPKITGSDPSYLYVGKVSTPAQRLAVRHSFGLDKPVPVQYWDYMKGAVHGDFGVSFFYESSVWSLTVPRIPVTLELLGYASALSLLVTGPRAQRAGMPLHATPATR